MGHLLGFVSSQGRCRRGRSDSPWDKNFSSAVCLGRRLLGSRSRSLGNYLQGTPRHRDAPPDQQEEGNSLRLALGGAADACTAGGGAWAIFGLGRQSEESAASPSHRPRGTGLASLRTRRVAGGGANGGGGGNALGAVTSFAASGRLLRTIEGGSAISPGSR